MSNMSNVTNVTSVINVTSLINATKAAVADDLKLGTAPVWILVVCLVVVAIGFMLMNACEKPRYSRLSGSRSIPL